MSNKEEISIELLKIAKSLVSKEESAADRYKIHRKNVDRTLSKIKNKLIKNDKQQSRKENDWGYVGSMEHVSELLEEVSEFLG